ncbi:hypothetical protein LZ32DRAFT_695234 [Colletotrichum eremochloae]|nr:hypothetical protein LZ32DRAFT_695234 [Colletotrichum eremochloae]
MRRHLEISENNQHGKDFPRICEQIGVATQDTLKYQGFSNRLAVIAQTLAMLLIDRTGRLWPLIGDIVLNSVTVVTTTVLLVLFPAGRVRQPQRPVTREECNPWDTGSTSSSSATSQKPFFFWMFLPETAGRLLDELALQKQGLVRCRED